MTIHKASLGPARTGSSIGILVGQAAYHSATLLRARQWARAVTGAAGGPPVAQLGFFSSDPADAGALVDGWSRQAASAAPPLPLLDATLGGLRGHTLVWLVHAAQDPRPAIALYRVARQVGSADTTLDEPVLSALQVTGDQVRSPGGDARARAVGSLLGAIRASVFDRLVVLHLGEGPALDGLAARLRALIGRPVYHSRRGVTLTTEGAPRAAVTGARGVAWFSEAEVELSAGPDSFFAGAEGRVL